MASLISDTQVFVKVVERGSFVAAATALGLPKTTVSRKVRELERRLGTALLLRTTRKLTVTEAGALYFAQGQRILLDLENAERSVSELGGSAQGVLRVTVAHSIASQVIAPLLPDFGRRFPGLRIDLALNNQRVDLLDADVDMALRLGPKPLPDSDLVARPLGKLPLQLFATAAYVADHGMPQLPCDLYQHRTLALSAHRSNSRFAWSLVNADGESVEAPINPGVVSDDPGPLFRALLADGGIMLASPRLLSEALAGGDLLRVLPAWSGQTLTLNALYPRGKQRSPKLRAFVDFLLERLAL